MTDVPAGMPANAVGLGRAGGAMRDPAGADVPFPAGWGVVLDPSARRTDGGRVLIGGTPLRILRLTEAGARLIDQLVAGDPVPEGAGSRRLVRRLVDAGAAHPVPPTGSAVLGPADVTVVIPVLDDAAGLGRTLATLGPVAAVVVIDDGSADPGAIERAAAGSADASLRIPQQERRRSQVAVRRLDRNVGPGPARQAALDAGIDTPVVAFVDAGVELPAGWLEPLLAHLGDPDVGAVAPRVRSAPGDAPAWLAAYEDARSSLDLGPRAAPVRPRSRVSYVPTAALLVRTQAVQAVGGFAPDLRVGEDVDLVWRLLEAGVGLRYEPAVEARHPSRPCVGAWLRQRFRYGTAAARLARRHPRAAAPLTTSGWSALAWGLVVAGHPVLGAATAATTTAALTPKLANLEHPIAEAVRLAGAGNLHAGRAVADALRRPWWPLAALLAWKVPRSRPALVAAAFVPPLLERRERPVALDPVRYTALRLADDLAYGTGVLAGCVAERSVAALLPAFSGPLDPVPSGRADGGSLPNRP